MLIVHVMAEVVCLQVRFETRKCVALSYIYSSVVVVVDTDLRVMSCNQGAQSHEFSVDASLLAGYLLTYWTNFGEIIHFTMSCRRYSAITISVTICGDACPLSCVSAEAYKLAQCTRYSAISLTEFKSVNSIVLETK